MTAMICVIDGPRSSGKTTIVNAVIDRFKHSSYDVRLHKTNRPSESLWKGINQTLDFWQSEPDSITYLVDRFHLTEYVYSTAYSRVDDFDLNRYFKAFDKRMSCYQGWMRYTALMCSEHELYDRTNFRQDGKTFDMQPELAWHLWSLAVAKSDIATLRINEDVVHQQQIIEDIIDWIKNPSRYKVEL